jgi:hypothetical protein
VARKIDLVSPSGFEGGSFLIKIQYFILPRRRLRPLRARRSVYLIYTLEGLCKRTDRRALDSCEFLIGWRYTGFFVRPLVVQANLR